MSSGKEQNQCRSASFRLIVRPSPIVRTIFGRRYGLSMQIAHVIKLKCESFWAPMMSTGKVGGRLMFMTRCWDVWRLCLRGPSVTFCHGFRLRHAAIRSSQCWAPVSRCVPVYQIQHSFRANNTVIARAGTTGILSQYRPVRPPSISESPIVAIAIIITSIL